MILGGGFEHFYEYFLRELPVQYHEVESKYRRKLQKRLYRVYQELVQRYPVEMEEGMDNAFFLSKDLSSGPSTYPIPPASRQYHNIDSKKRGGAKVKVRNGRK